MQKSVILGISGGIDSAVSAYLLKEKGYLIHAVYLDMTKREYNQDVEDVEKLSKEIGFEYSIINVKEDFEEIVVKYFLDEYGEGKTPSPCVICDERVKFNTLLKIAEDKGADYVATGHYANTAMDEESKKVLISKGKDNRKDQSYMLYRLTPNNIKKVIFPLGKKTKIEVREIGKRIGVSVKNKPDSQGICFAKNGYKSFLNENLKGIRSGNLINKGGEILGKHQGYQLYTVGQRRGLGLENPEPFFITKIIPETNEIVLGDYRDLYCNRVILQKWIYHLDIDSIEEKQLWAKPRFSSHGFDVKVRVENNLLICDYFLENTHNSPGQHLVLYLGEKVVGGGEIKKLVHVQRK